MSQMRKRETWRKRQAYLTGVAAQRQCPACKRKSAMSALQVDAEMFIGKRTCRYCGHVVEVKEGVAERTEP